MKKNHSLKTKIKKFFGMLGPGLVTGAGDDDPSGIATCSQTGAQFGFNQLWTAFLMLPLLIAVQEACARIGACKGKGLAAVISYYYSKKLAYCFVTLLLIANIINLGADLGSITIAAQLIFPINYTVMIILFSIFIICSQIFIGYNRYSKLLIWLCLTMFAYPLTVIVINAPLATVIKATFIPHIDFNFKFLFFITGLFGTTISPYMFFWQASHEVEENHQRRLVSQSGKIRMNKKEIFRIRVDNLIGMIFSQIVSWSIIVVSATAFYLNGIHEIKSAPEAAKLLEPLVHHFPHAGFLAKLIFALGIIGLGLITIPVLAASASYAITEVLKLKNGLNLKYKSGRYFYNIIIVSVLIGVAINYMGIDPFKALVFAAVINGVLAVPMIFIITLIAKNEKIMGNNKSGILSQTFLWITFFSMLASSLSMFFTIGK